MDEEPEEPQGDAAPKETSTTKKMVYLAVSLVVFGAIVFFMLRDILN